MPLSSSGNDKLGCILDNLQQQFQRCRITLSHTEAVTQSVRQHREIIGRF